MFRLYRSPDPEPVVTGDPPVADPALVVTPAPATISLEAFTALQAQHKSLLEKMNSSVDLSVLDNLGAPAVPLTVTAPAVTLAPVVPTPAPTPILANEPSAFGVSKAEFEAIFDNQDIKAFTSVLNRFGEHIRSTIPRPVEDINEERVLRLISPTLRKTVDETIERRQTVAQVFAEFPLAAGMPGVTASTATAIAATWQAQGKVIGKDYSYRDILRTAAQEVTTQLQILEPPASTVSNPAAPVGTGGGGGITGALTADSDPEPDRADAVKYNAWLMRAHDRRMAKQQQKGK